MQATRARTIQAPVTRCCPVCQTALTPESRVCDCCGLVLQSALPASQGPLAPGAANLPALAGAAPTCLRCGASQRTTARVCARCGTPLVAPALPQPGQTLDQGRYTVQRVLSRGGMGMLYLASDHRAFDRPVVIKALFDLDHASPRLMNNLDRERLHQEGRLLAMLQHPHIPQIYGYFQDGPQRYIVMQYIDGTDLLQALTHIDEEDGQPHPGQPYPLEQVVRWGTTLCNVLEYLATSQLYPIVHQDIKPANLVLNQCNNELYLVDFGTATTRWLLPTGSRMGEQIGPFGTPGYAPPEQYSGQSEPRSDMYALAATLYHLATDDDPGQHPFDFPRLGYLGDVGAVLRTALDRDVTRRPTAAMFRQQLALVPGPLVLPSRYAPDGTPLGDIGTLVRWCEQHWNMAILWLASTLPDQIAAWWGLTSRMHELRTLARQHRDQHAALDAALALLDPDDFAQQPSRLLVATRVLDFGRVTSTNQERTLTIANTGRRYVRARLLRPDWLLAAPADILLAPGQQVPLKLYLDLAQTRRGDILHDMVLVQTANDTLARFTVRAAVSHWKPWR